MPKMQVYLPEELYEKIKSRTDRLNVSGILQGALAERLADLERLDALELLRSIPTRRSSARSPMRSWTARLKPTRSRRFAPVRRRNGDRQREQAGPRRRRVHRPRSQRSTDVGTTRHCPPVRAEDRDPRGNRRPGLATPHTSSTPRPSTQGSRCATPHPRARSSRRTAASSDRTRRRSRRCSRSDV